ncbi:unnamed protein product [Orchesella dallaii]|uniref:CRAL-TRIO domain-containing protein n=1 Tax=Orchesella dallaii TaxID=48710 RepID=A0ABP1RV97_9HEXA
MLPQFEGFLVIYFIVIFLSRVSIGNCAYSSTISMAEAQKLQDFKNRVEPLLTKNYTKTDFYLVRWLRAKDFNVIAAEAMLKEDIKWRRENKIDTIHMEEFQDFETEFPISVDTFDKKGRPGTLDLSHGSFRNVVATGRGHRFSRYFTMLMENMTNQVVERQKSGLNAAQWRAIINSEGVNMIGFGCPLCIRLLLQCLSVMDNHYPEWAYQVLVIEAPLAMRTIFDVAKPFMSRPTRESMLLFGSDKRQWMKYLDSEIDRAQRRELYGGIKPRQFPVN